MPVYTEPQRAAEHLVTEVGSISRDTVTIPANTTLKAGAVVARLTSGGAFKEFTPGASDGSETAAGVLLTDVTTEGSSGLAIIHARLCEVDSSKLVWKSGITTNQKNAGIASLRALNIIVRDGVTI
jgi:hypothetical protein